MFNITLEGLLFSLIFKLNIQGDIFYIFAFNTFGTILQSSQEINFFINVLKLKKLDIL